MKNGLGRELQEKQSEAGKSVRAATEGARAETHKESECFPPACVCN